MSKRRQPKKSESIEIRVEHEVKTALVRKAEAEGRSVSEVVRSFIAAYLAEQPKEARPMFISLWKPATALGAASIAIVWSALAPAPLSAAPDLTAAFAEFDRNGDKAITRDEFLNRSPDTLYVVKADRPPPGAGPTAMAMPLGRALPAPPPGADGPPHEMLASEFAKQDRNSDGSVTFEEFQAHHLAMLKTGFAAVDKNGDGSLDPAEYEAALAAGPAGPEHSAFPDIDANGDGRITEDEFFG